jgi:hypothetical protein
LCPTLEYGLIFIAILETCKRSFSDLKNLCVGKNFIWHCKEPSGRSEGILLCIDLDMFDIGSIDEGDFYVKFSLCNKIDSFKWALVAIYGPAQDNYKQSFLVELVNMCSHVDLPIVIGGDFNILRPRSFWLDKPIPCLILAGTNQPSLESGPVS